MVQVPRNTIEDPDIVKRVIKCRQVEEARKKSNMNDYKNYRHGIKTVTGSGEVKC